MTEKRTRQAVDRLVTHQFDRNGNRLWAQAKALLDHGHARMRIRQVAVPFGICVEPGNVKAGGHACPFRFRCLGCDRFRTDPSYLPDLRVYLDTLLRNRERLAAASELDDWARTEATPSDEEINRLRHLIRRVETDLDSLTLEDREEIREATATLRKSRTVQLGMPTVRPPAASLRLDRDA
ncbi:hypothetical protein [Kitasatospora sp. GP82]|uniref:hypothetical protein n=1 Tax=Kitasatospora sp. GP82 TaxID=3035089 RepID=UPI0024768E5A|nr:hypothetical protein [Kitasatospora sp. GP82]